MSSFCKGVSKYLELLTGLYKGQYHSKHTQVSGIQKIEKIKIYNLV